MIPKVACLIRSWTRPVLSKLQCLVLNTICSCSPTCADKAQCSSNHIENGCFKGFRLTNCFGLYVTSSLGVGRMVYRFANSSRKSNYFRMSPALKSFKLSGKSWLRVMFLVLSKRTIFSVDFSMIFSVMTWLQHGFLLVYVF